MAYVEVLSDERRGSATAFPLRAARWFRERGVRIERVMTVNGSCYISKRFRKAVRRLGARHIRTRPYTPKTNGEAERFIRILLAEGAYAIPYKSSDARNRDLPRRLDWCNRRRSHSALNGRTPVAAMNNLLRNHSESRRSRCSRDDLVACFEVFADNASRERIRASAGHFFLVAPAKLNQWCAADHRHPSLSEALPFAFGRQASQLGDAERSTPVPGPSNRSGIASYSACPGAERCHPCASEPFGLLATAVLQCEFSSNGFSVGRKICDGLRPALNG